MGVQGVALLPLRTKHIILKENKMVMIKIISKPMKLL